MKVIQINLNHCEPVQDLLVRTVVDEDADVVLIGGPYKIPENNMWIHDKGKQATMWEQQLFLEIETRLEALVGYWKHLSV